jgi:Zn-dependent M28 family amino/carboxypeptidase
MQSLPRGIVKSIFILIVLAGCKSHTAPTTEPSHHPTTAASTFREAGEVKTTLNYLASDEMEGRGLLTEGINKAATYITDQFKSAGLEPLPALNGYSQEFPITVSQKVNPSTSLSVGDKPLKLDTDFTPLGLSAEKSFSAPIVFVGYSINNPEQNYDDYAGVDVKGKIALAFRYEPGQSSQGGFSERATFKVKAKNAADHGAIALLIVNTSKNPDKLISLERSSDEKSTIAVLQITRAAAASLLQEAGAPDLEKLQGDLDSTHKPNSFALSKSAGSGSVAFITDRRSFKNIVGFVSGTGPHKDEYVVIGAHYDHLGRGERGSMAANAKQIHNGADDNGSGTTAVLELAKLMGKKYSGDRSLIFATFVGEERGLLGSEYFVEHPPVPLEKITAMLNLDMVGRVKNDVVFVGGNGTAKDFDELLKKADENSPLILKNAGVDVGGRGGIGPSDHMSFAMKKIPVIFIWTGMHADYHRPSDKVDKINFLGIAEVVDFCRELIPKLAALPREQYVDSYDKMRGTGMSGMKVRLGIMPDYNADPAIVGVRVAGTMPDSPASKAGLKDGDVIVQIAKDKIASLGDYMTALGKYKPDDAVTITVERDKKRVDLNAILSAPKD